MADTWTINKKLDILKDEVSTLKDQAHEPIFTREMADEIITRLEKIEAKVFATPKVKPKTKASA